MPFVRVSLRQGTSAEYRKAIADGVHQAMIDALGIPLRIGFQVITECRPEDLIYDPAYLNVKRRWRTCWHRRRDCGARI